MGAIPSPGAGLLLACRSRPAWPLARLGPAVSAGYGLLSFYADDTAELIRIFDITWIG